MTGSTGSSFETIYDLDIHEQAHWHLITYGQYYILNFNFQQVEDVQELNNAVQELSANIIWSLKEFYHTYGMYLEALPSDHMAANIYYPNCISCLRNLVSHVNYKLLKAKHGGDAKPPLTNS